MHPRTTLALLGLVLLLGAGLRLLPLAQYPVWGSDSGEYHALTARLLSSGRVSTEYDGWGIAYPYFPGIFVLAGAVSATTGLEPLPSLLVTIPAIASLSVLALFLIARRLFHDDRAALLAGAFGAVAMPHVFATSHAMPGSLGHLLALAVLLGLVLSHRDRRALPFLLLAVAALLPTHHLTVYVLILALAAAPLLREMLSERSDRRRLRLELPLLLFLGLAALLYWLLLAPPFGESLGQVVPFAPALLVPLFVLGALAGAGLVKLRRRVPLGFVPGPPSRRDDLFRLAAFGVGAAALVAAFALVGIPGTDIHSDAAAMINFVPVMALAGLALLGLARAQMYRHGLLAYGWALALLASFVVAWGLGSHVLIAYRHAEYLAEPMALLAGLGGIRVLDRALERWHGDQRAPTAAAVAVAGLVALNAAAAYPDPSVLAGFFEGYTPAEVDAARWARGQIVLPPDGVVATDHRLSSLLFGFAGLNATWDSARRTLHATTFEGARGEMEAVGTPSGVKRVDFVVVSSEMREGVALVQWEPALPMSDEAYAKFSEPPFRLICDSGEVQVFRVEWAGTGGMAAVGACRD